MKKTIALILCLIMCLSLLSACGGKTETPPADTSGGKTEAPPADTSGAKTEAPTSNTSGENAQSGTFGDDISGQPEPQETTKYAETVTYLFSDSVGVINARVPAGDGATHNNTCRMIYDTLYLTKADGTTEPMLATSYETEDYQTWTFHLRDDVKFHNGDKFTAKDVVYTWKTAIEATGTAAETYSWGYVVDAKVIDDYTVELKTAEPYNALLFNLGIDVGGIINERAINEDPVAGYYVGTGAYKITEFSPNDVIKFERNDDYWGELPPTKYMEWKNVPEASTRAIMVQNGTAQLSGIAGTDIPLFEGDDNFGIHTVIAGSSMSLMFNFNDPICGDINFRKAVAYAIDREELAIFALGALANPVYDGTIWGCDTPYKNESIQPITQDLDKAKDYLGQSAYKGEEIEMAIMPSSVKLAEALQQQLDAVGIKITINKMDVPSFQGYTTGANSKAQMLAYFCMTSQNPVDAYRANFYPGAASNKMNYNNPEVTALMDSSQSVLGEDAQRELYYKLQELVVDDLPAIPIYWMTSALAFRKGVGGVITSSSAHYDLRYLYYAE